MVSLVAVSSKGRRSRTTKFSLQFEESIPRRVLGVIISVNAEAMFANCKQVIALHVAQLFSAAERESMAFDLEDRLSVGVLDVERVA